jgi:ABC-type taurine transport system ATPase subunit
VLSPRPGRIIEDISLHFSREYVQDRNAGVKYTEKYFKIREELIKKISL